MFYYGNKKKRKLRKMFYYGNQKKRKNPKHCFIMEIKKTTTQKQCFIMEFQQQKLRGQKKHTPKQILSGIIVTYARTDAC